MDKAGAYGVQGAGSLLIERIEGCFLTWLAFLGEIVPIAGTNGLASRRPVEVCRVRAF